MAARSVPSRRMKVLHLAAGNRWTGAAAPAFAETEALREAGVEAHYAYVGGYKLQQKLAHYDFAHPIIAKAQNPFSFARTVEAISRMVDHHRFDIVHAHLTYDHCLALVATRGTRTKVVRTFHARRVLRRDPFTRWLIARSNRLCVINDSFVDAPSIRERDPIFTPPPVDQRQFAPHGADVRDRYGIGSDEGHRAVLEPMACGIAPVSFPIEGIPALLGDLAPRLIAQASSPEAAAAKVIAASADLASLRRAAYEQSQKFGYAQAAARLIEVYRSA